MIYAEYPSPLGTLGLGEDGGYLTNIWFAGEPRSGQLGTSKLLQETARQLDEYFAGERQEFDLPLKLEGTEFRRLVWQALLTIPYGHRASYGDIARQIGRPSAPRAVGGANHHNPIPIIVPCHRVVGSSGSLVGYGGGLDTKQYLLALEETGAAAGEAPKARPRDGFCDSAPLRAE